MRLSTYQTRSLEAEARRLRRRLQEIEEILGGASVSPPAGEPSLDHRLHFARTQAPEHLRYASPTLTMIASVARAMCTR